MEQVYNSSNEHLNDMLLLIDKMIFLEEYKYYAALHRQKNIALEIGRALDSNRIEFANELSYRRNQNSPTYTTLLKGLNESQEKINNRAQISAQKGVHLPFFELQRKFNLSEPELMILCSCYAARSSIQYRNVFSLLNNDRYKKYPTIGLLEEMIGDPLEQRPVIKNFFSHDLPLRKYSLIEFGKTEQGIPPIEREVHISERIYDYINECNNKQYLPSYVEIIAPQNSIEDMMLPGNIDNIKEDIRTFIDTHRVELEKDSGNYMFYFCSEPGASGGNPWRYSWLYCP